MEIGNRVKLKRGGLLFGIGRKPKAGEVGEVVDASTESEGRIVVNFTDTVVVVKKEGLEVLPYRNMAEAIENGDYCRECGIDLGGGNGKPQTCRSCKDEKVNPKG